LPSALPGSPPASATPPSATVCEAAMLDAILGGIVIVVLLVYLTAALIRPERF
jgi:K+-transporting ATPase KdpF subunit